MRLNSKSDRLSVTAIGSTSILVLFGSPFWHNHTTLEHKLVPCFTRFFFIIYTPLFVPSLFVALLAVILQDMAFLCGTIYVGAGFDAAVIDATDHAALLIWLPEYPNADYYWDLNDGRGSGWIWIEATGSENPVGWTPSEYEDGYWIAYQINSQPYVALSPAPSEPTFDDAFLLLFIVIAAIITLLSRIRR